MFYIWSIKLLSWVFFNFPQTLKHWMQWSLCWLCVSMWWKSTILKWPPKLHSPPFKRIVANFHSTLIFSFAKPPASQFFWKEFSVMTFHDCMLVREAKNRECLLGEKGRSVSLEHACHSKTENRDKERKIKEVAVSSFPPWHRYKKMSKNVRQNKETTGVTKQSSAIFGNLLSKSKTLSHTQAVFFFHCCHECRSCLVVCNLLLSLSCWILDDWCHCRWSAWVFKTSFPRVWCSILNWPFSLDEFFLIITS